MPAPASPKGSKAGIARTSPSYDSIDAIALLESDHREVEAYFATFDDLDDLAERKALAQQICLALTVHATIEEEIFYPAAREAIEDADLLDEATVEHEGAKILVAQIQDMLPDHPLFAAKVRVLGDQISHHVEEEENELFPQVRESELDLKALGETLAARKAELMAQLAPSA